MPVKIFLKICLLKLALFHFTLIAQDMPHFLEKLTTTEGISSNRITDLLQDETGFLWITTSDGLNRYDGTEVLQYFHRPGQNSIPHNYVYCIKKLTGHNLALGTHNGLSFLDTKTSKFKNFYYRQNSRLDEFNNIITILETDTKGNLWAGSRNSIYIFDSLKQLKKIISSPFTESDTYHERIRFVLNIFPLSNGNVLLNLYNGWFIAAAPNYTLQPAIKSGYARDSEFMKVLSDSPYTRKNENIFTGSNIFKIYDRYFICIKSGADSLLLFNEDGKKLSSCYFPFNHYPFVSWSQKVSAIDSSRLLFLYHNYGLSLVPLQWRNGKPILLPTSSLVNEQAEYIKAIGDKQGNWWMATAEEGLQKANPKKQGFTGISLTDTKTGNLIKYETNYISRYGNRLWVATYGNGFFEIDLISGNKKQYLFHKTGNDVWANFCWNIRQVHADTLWIGTQAGLFWYNIAKKNHGRITGYAGKPPLLDSIAITTQFSDSRGNIWMGLGKGNGVCYLNKQTKRFTYYPGKNRDAYPLRYPLRIAEDVTGNLWFTSDAGSALVKYNRHSASFETIELPFTGEQYAGSFYGLYCDGDSVIWLGAVTRGLIKYNRVKNVVQIYDREQGLPSSRITSIYRDNINRIWLATDAGLSIFNIVNERCTNYTLNEGLPVKHPVADFFYDSISNRLYNGGNGALFYSNPLYIQDNPPSQKTIITDIYINGKPVIINKQPLEFSHAQNDVTIFYTAVDLANGKANQYAYKLIGADTAWIIVGKQRQINFSNLAPGHYSFMVRSLNNSGIWSNDVATILFLIRPAFTQTRWFYVLVFLALVLLFYALYRFRLNQLMRTERIRTEISKDLHDEVGSALTNISLESLLAQKQLHNEPALKNLLERIQEDSRKVSETLREIVWSINPAVDTADEAFPHMLRNAAELLEAQNIQVEANISPGMEHLVIPMTQRRDMHLIFKEAINNIIKHAKCTKVMISIELINRDLKMKISDNGIGFKTTAKQAGNGMKNMKDRAVKHGWKIKLESRINYGTTLTLHAHIA